MKTIDEMVAGCRTVAILGHIRPDGDCVGSTLGVWNYLRINYPEIRANVYLEPFSEKFMFLSGADRVLHEIPEESVDLCLIVDVSDEKRIGFSEPLFRAAKKRICVDHHVSNTGFAEESIVVPDAAAASEVLVHLMRPEAMDLSVAECLYLGMVHDTGVFKHSNTTKVTMETAGSLLPYGVNTSRIIDGTFYRKSYKQNRALGFALMKSRLLADGAVVYTWLSAEDLRELDVTHKDLDGIVDQIRLTDGIELAVFLTELKPGIYKLSLRSNDWLDVNRVAGAFGGGGHVRAAGCEIAGDAEMIMEKIVAEMEKQKSEWTA